jgi:secreted trypsin-like serine protease
MVRRLALLTLLMVAAVPGPAALGASTVVGGTTVQVASAPWVVALRQTVRGGSLVCTGAVLDALHVLTAGHCVFDLTGTLAPPAAFAVRAGASNYLTPAAGDTVQDRGVSSYRVHPRFSWSTGVSADDVAVLALTAPLDLGTPQVQAAPLPTDGALYPPPAALTLAAFGRESTGAPDGSLNALTATIDPQGECGTLRNTVLPGNNAVAFCSSASTASLCSGDSGAALVTADPPHTIVGIASAGPTSCTPGGHALLTNVEAPEILDFIRGNDQPPTAPRPSGTTYVRLGGDTPFHVGTTVTCTSGDWDGAPAITYVFLDRRTGTVVQSGAKGTLLLTDGLVGAELACRAVATNAGGSAVLETLTTGTVEPTPKLDIERIPPVTAHRGRKVQVRVWLDAEAGLNGTYGVCVLPPARVGTRACASQRVTSGGGGGRFPLTVSLRIKNAAPLGVARLGVSAVAGPSQGQSAVVLRVVR